MSGAARPPVVLVDLDGTVLRDRAGRPSMLRAVREVAGRDAPDDDRLTFAGRTDAWVARELLRRAGHAADPEAVRRVHARYLVHLAESLPVRGCVAIPGARALGEALLDAARRGRCAPPLLLTGNLREAARRKLAAAGLAEVYPSEGAFGDVREDRDDLARDAHALSPGCAPVVLGDAPADVRAARAIGARVVVVATGPAPREALLAEGPDVLLDGLTDVDAVLAALFPAR